MSRGIPEFFHPSKTYWFFDLQFATPGRLLLTVSRKAITRRIPFLLSKRLLIYICFCWLRYLFCWIRKLCEISDLRDAINVTRPLYLGIIFLLILQILRQAFLSEEHFTVLLYHVMYCFCTFCYF